MTQKGTVIKTENNKALVAVPRASACGDHCASCAGGCQARGHNVWLENDVNAKPGDRVLLSASTASVLRGSLWMYCFPLILFFLGYGTVFSITESSGWATVASLLALSFGFLLLHFFDKRLAPKTKIIEILNPDGSGKDETHGI